jgi:Tfp pilus assembly protein PilE
MKNLRTLNILRNVTWGGGNFKDKSTAYTLAEVIVVLLVVAIIVSISIKATKNKLNRITPIAYYSAVSTVRSVTEEMLKDFQTNDDYLSKGFNLFPPAFAIQDIGTSSFANNYYQQFYCPVYMDTYPTVSYIYELNGYKFNPTKIPVESYFHG